MASLSQRNIITLAGSPGVATISGLCVGCSPKNEAGFRAIEARDQDQFQNECPVLFHAGTGAAAQRAFRLEDGLDHRPGSHGDHPQRVYCFPEYVACTIDGQEAALHNNI